MYSIAVFIESLLQKPIVSSPGSKFTKLLKHIRKIFCNFKMLLQQTIHGKWVIYDYYSCYHNILMISALKTTFSLNNLRILRPKVTKNLTNSLKKFCEFPPGSYRRGPLLYNWTIVVTDQKIKKALTRYK